MHQSRPSTGDLSLHRPERCQFRLERLDVAGKDSQSIAGRVWVLNRCHIGSPPCGLGNWQLVERDCDPDRLSVPGGELPPPPLSSEVPG